MSFIMYIAWCLSAIGDIVWGLNEFHNGYSMVSECHRGYSVVPCGDECHRGYGVVSECHKGYSVDAVFLDFWKALDTVQHRRLLSEVAAHGYGGQTMAVDPGFPAWPAARACCQRLSLHTSKCDRWHSPRCHCCDQCSWHICISDLPHHVLSTLKMFADGTKLYTCSGEDATRTMQEDWRTAAMVQELASLLSSRQMMCAETRQWSVRGHMLHGRDNKWWRRLLCSANRKWCAERSGGKTWDCTDKIFIEHNHNSIMKISFSDHIVPDWNTLT